MITVDWYVCVCGNRPDTDGFYPCDSDGNDVEPVLDGSWDGLYRCDRCRVVFRPCRDTEDTWREQSVLLSLAGRSMVSADDLVGKVVWFVKNRRTYSGTVVGSLRVAGELSFHVIGDDGRPWSAVRLREMTMIGGE